MATVTTESPIDGEWKSDRHDSTRIPKPLLRTDSIGFTHNNPPKNALEHYPDKKPPTLQIEPDSDDESNEDPEWRKEVAFNAHSRLVNAFDRVRKKLPLADDDPDYVHYFINQVQHSMPKKLERAGNEGLDCRTILHSILAPPDKFQSRITLFHWAMKKYDELYIFGAKEGKSILHLAVKGRDPDVELSDTPIDGRLRQLVSSYPGEIWHILKEAPDKDQLLKHIVPFIRYDGRSEFLDLFSSVEHAETPQKVSISLH